MAVLRTKLLLVVTYACILWPHVALAAQVELANGVFLVAKPELLDPNFRQAVVLITQPQVGGGPIGVVINRPLRARLSEVFPGMTQVPEQFDVIYAGGPVQRERVLYLFRSGERPPHSLQVLQDVYLSGDRELLEKILRGEVQVPAFRAYSGYSGWAPRQLQAEVAAGGWYIVQADADTIFAADPMSIWPALIKRITTRSIRFVVPGEVLTVE